MADPTIQLQVRYTDNTPIYTQLYTQIKGQILRNELPSSYPLPSIRTTAAELKISVITVKKAWDQLEAEGLIYAVHGKGCFVAELGKDQRRAQVQDEVRQRVRSDLAYYKSLGLDLRSVMKLFEEEEKETTGG